MSDSLLEGISLPDKLYFRIGEISDIVGVDSHVLRYWESEFEIKPHRSSSGQRLYRKQELVHFLRIKNLVHGEGYTISGARRILNNGPKTGSNPSMPLEQVKDVLGRITNLRKSLSDYRQEILNERS
jgi:DNA-binding transcriptional MerR regulator